mmetsp:Transcript_35496/g.31989  ORF Transcript_35496/g.31989 Transcript_35496/m.31989 type:complete len:101 (-) Transcript_35496:554-856(-)
MGGKIAEGSVTDLFKMSRPAIISYHKTFIESLASEYVYTNYLDKAALAKDPLDRMKYTACFFISGWHRNAVEMMNKGPLDSLTGETHSTYKEDGTGFYIE